VRVSAALAQCSNALAASIQSQAHALWPTLRTSSERASWAQIGPKAQQINCSSSFLPAAHCHTLASGVQWPLLACRLSSLSSVERPREKQAEQAAATTSGDKLAKCVPNLSQIGPVCARPARPELRCAAPKGGQSFPSSPGRQFREKNDLLERQVGAFWAQTAPARPAVAGRSLGPARLRSCRACAELVLRTRSQLAGGIY